MDLRTVDDLKAVRAKYNAVLEANRQEIARLEREMTESREAIGTAEKKAAAAAVIADFETYQAENNKATMHKQRIKMHEKKLEELRNGHLISKAEYEEVNRAIVRLATQLKKEKAVAFMQAYETMQAIAAEFAREIGECQAAGRLVYEKVYKEMDPYISDRVKVYSNLNGYNDFENLMQSFAKTGSPEMLHFSNIKSMAGKR